MSVPRSPAPHLAILGAAAELDAPELLALHRGVSRLATRVRMGQRDYQQQMAAGLACARSLGRLTADIARRTGTGPP